MFENWLGQWRSRHICVQRRNYLQTDSTSFWRNRTHPGSVSYWHFQVSISTKKWFILWHNLWSCPCVPIQDAVQTTHTPVTEVNGCAQMKLMPKRNHPIVLWCPLHVSSVAWPSTFHSFALWLSSLTTQRKEEFIPQLLTMSTIDTASAVTKTSQFLSPWFSNTAPRMKIACTEAYERVRLLVEESLDAPANSRLVIWHGNEKVLDGLETSNPVTEWWIYSCGLSGPSTDSSL